LRRSLPVLAAVGLLGIAAAGAVVAYQWITHSPRFALREIEITGNQQLTAEYVRARADLTTGQNLFEVDLSGAREALEHDPWIARARVNRRLPDRLLIEIEERRAAALVDLGALYLADVTGQPFKKADISTGEGSGLPVVTGIDRREFLNHSGDARERIERAVAAADLYRQNPDRPKLGEVHVDEWHGLSMYTYDRPIAIRVGRGDLSAVEKRLRLFDRGWASLSSQERRRARTIHLDRGSDPDRMTVAFARAK
jgi:cell division septal protein FtsQ